MSYCRFAWDNSDVYVYESDAGLECCGCKLSPWGVGVTFNEGDLGDKDRTLNPATFMRMIVHLRMHRAMGHVVPMYATAALSEEAGLWTMERILWWNIAQARRVVRFLWCDRFGHKPVPSLITSAEFDREFGAYPYRKCAVCGEGYGVVQDDGTVRWIGDEIREERKKKASA